MTAEMEQSPKQSPAAVEPVADLIERLTKERDDLRTYAHEATKAITGLTAGGSEYFGRKIGDMYTADLPFCVNHIRERMNKDFERFLTERIAKHAAEAELAEVVAALEPFAKVARLHEDARDTTFVWVCDYSSHVDREHEDQCLRVGDFRRARAVVKGAGQS